MAISEVHERRDRTVASGMMSRGKYTFLNEVRAADEVSSNSCVSPVAKKVHGTSAANEKSG